MLRKMIFPILATIFFTHSISSAVEWRFASQAKPNETTLLLGESPSMLKGCEGKNEASEQMYALEKWTYVRELCYKLDKSEVKFLDPNKVMFFNTFTRPASGFITIPSKKELAEAAEREESERRIRGLNESTRMLNEEISRRQTRNDEIRRQQSQRRPTICNHIGDMSVCN